MDFKKLQENLQLSYNKENWKDLLKDIFGTQIHFELQSEKIYIEKDQIVSAERFGAISLSDNKNIAILDITTSNDIKIALNRVKLRELVVRLIDQDVYHGLLVFYHSVDNSQIDYRLSLITQQNVIDEDGKFLKEGIHPKRYSFVLGPNKSCHTPAQRLLGLKKQTFTTLNFNEFSGITIKDITDAFSVEALTKEFYNELANWFFFAVQKVQFPADEVKDEDVRNASYTIRLITRLIFVWFLKQKKLVPDELFEEDEIKKILNFSDKTGSTYYKAILQNLFFATLNTEMSCEQRKFINRQYGIQGFYRYERFFQDKERFLDLTHNIPFLNGGLFENLDRNVGKSNEIRIDCFSNRISNETRLIVPDYLFFNGTNNANLNVSYGDNNHSNVSVRGLIDILKTYNFTVEESSPYEIEVALDPELLGAVFENLLASYNPETKTTARKITGSFYTPREIVNYMVDESIIAYLKNNLISNAYLPLDDNQLCVFDSKEVKQGLLNYNLKKSCLNNHENELTNKLRALISYDFSENEFNENDTKILIKAIDDCKILDPACGSGAFPMGVLHKLVHILSKLDPNNHYWQRIQEKRAKSENAEFISRIEKDRELANQLAFVDLRNKITKELDLRLEEIKKSFDINANEPDYARKLFLIENCIYGIDIQPIAVQIAKLRFFISLVIDQKIDDNKPNRGILTLPNLETKFVAANTLLCFATNQLKPLSVYPLEAELIEVRHKLFLARTPETKKKYREQDFMLREEIAGELKAHGFPPISADKIAHWNPYDQGQFADFYDSEWMFGLQTGFDIVIGNPPYISIQRMKNEEKLSLKDEKYKSFENSGDIYALFYERGNQLLKSNGILSYITSRQWMQASYGKSLRNFFASETNLTSRLNS